MEVDTEPMPWADEPVVPDTDVEPAPMDALLDTALSSSTSLASRIGTTRVYLLSDMAAPRASKRKADAEDADADEDAGPADAADDVSSDPDVRANALLLHGPPVTELPTARLFAYATQLGAAPLALEWVADDTCVLVFASAAAARAGLAKLRRDVADDDGDGWPARAVPAALWPAPARLSAAGLPAGDATAETLRDALRVRWARTDDVKAKNARGASAFYRKHGAGAGKEVWSDEPGRTEAPRKRRRAEDGGGEDAKRSALDAEMDAFLESRDAPAEAPADRARFDKTSERVYPEDERGGADAGTGGRRRGGRGRGRERADAPREAENGVRRERGGRRDGGGGGRRDGGSTRTPAPGSKARPHKSAEELDAELEAFLGAR